MLQGLILDLTYSTQQLKTFAAISAIIVQKDLGFSQTYTVDMLTNTITPDPTDNDFCLFVAMNAAILIVKNEIKGAASQSIRITDGPSTIDVTSYTKNLTDYYKTLTDDYEKAKLSFIRNGNHGLSITTPTTIK